MPLKINGPSSAALSATFAAKADLLAALESGAFNVSSMVMVIENGTPVLLLADQAAGPTTTSPSRTTTSTLMTRGA